MSDQDLLSKKELKDSIPGWVKSFCATLVCLSLFINSIGLNLMQINTALTEHLVNKIKGRSANTQKIEEKINAINSKCQSKFDKIESDIEILKINSHKAGTK